MIIRFNQDPRTCQYAECGRRFKPTHPAQLYCHPNCKYNVQLASLRTQYAEERGTFLPDPVPTGIVMSSSCPSAATKSTTWTNAASVSPSPARTIGAERKLP